MRVLQAMAGAEFGGAEAFFMRLAPALDRAGIEQRLVIRRRSDRVRALGEAGLEPLVLPFGGPLDRTTAPRLADEFDAFRPDIVLSWMNRATRFCARARGGRKLVHVGRLGGYYDPRYYKGCDHLIGNTPDIVAYLADHGWPDERLHFVPNFAAAGKSPPTPRDALATPGDAPLLLALGRLHANKAFDVLIRALADLPGAWLWLAGEGGERDRLEALAGATGTADRVRFLGWRGDVAALMAAADVLVCPSRIEPLGNVIVEAWAQRLPVVAAAAAGPRWLIEPDETGLLAPVDDAAALADAVGRVIADRAFAERLAAAGHAEYAARFTEAAVVRQYVRLFETVAS